MFYIIEFEHFITLSQYRIYKRGFVVLFKGALSAK